MIAVAVTALLAFSPPGMKLDQAMSRRTVFSGVAAAVAAAPLAANADGASSPAVRERARAIYGSRVARLADASVDAIIDEKNCFTLFTTGVYRTDAASKAKKADLTAASKKALAAAKSGDKAGANAAVKEFIKIGEINANDDLELSIYNPKQRRNAGAPTTDTILDQMASQKYALYAPLADGAKPAKK